MTNEQPQAGDRIPPDQQQRLRFSGDTPSPVPRAPVRCWRPEGQGKRLRRDNPDRVIREGRQENLKKINKLFD